VSGLLLLSVRVPGLFVLALMGGWLSIILPRQHTR
jgi:hypothetical protein